MVMARTFSPSSIQIRFGRSLEVYAEAVYQNDLEAASNALDVARGDLDVHMTPAERRGYDESPGYAIGDARSRQEVLHDMELRRRRLLSVATRHNVYAKAPDEVGDADALDQEGP